MKRSHRRLSFAAATAVVGAVVILLSTSAPALAQDATGTYSPRPQVQTGGPPTPVPPSDVVLSLPTDQYLHEGAPLSGGGTWGH